MKSAFQIFDVNGDGVIDNEELKKLFAKQDMTDGQLKAIIKDFDFNADGGVNYEEFEKIMLKMLDK